MTSRNQVTAVVLVLVLVGVLDFVTRVYVPRSAAGRDVQFEVAAPSMQPMSLAEARQRLQSWLPVAAPAPPPGGPPEGSTGDPGTEGSDLADRVELGGWRFVLRGIFAAGPRFAVIDVVPANGGDVEQYRLSVGDAVNGVRLERISGRRITLSDGKRKIQLTLFIDRENDMAYTTGSDE